MGTARCAPAPPPSTTTATAIYGLSAGAKPMNQLCGASRRPAGLYHSCRQFERPGTFAPPANDFPNGPSTASCVGPVGEVWASNGEMTCDQADNSTAVTLPSLERSSSAGLGCMSRPLLAMVDADQAHLERHDQDLGLPVGSIGELDIGHGSR